MGEPWTNATALFCRMLIGREMERATCTASNRLDSEKGRQADRDRYHPKRLTILEYRCLDCGNPIASRIATPNTRDDDRPSLDSALLRRQCLGSATRQRLRCAERGIDELLTGDVG